MIDPITVLLSFMISGICGILAYLIQSVYFTDNGEDEEEEIELGDEYSSPEYSTALLEYFRKTIEEWMVLRFVEWNERYTFEKSNRTSFENLYRDILNEFFKEYFNEDAINFEYTLFTQDFLVQYIVKIASNTLNRLIKRRIEEEEE